MDITDIAVEEFVEIDTQERLGKVRSLFENERPKGIVVTEDGEYRGIIGEKQLLQSHIEDDTKASAVMQSAPQVDRQGDVRETARVLVEGDARIAPVFENDDLWGVVTGDAILEAVLENLDALTIEQIFTEDVVTIGEGDRLGQAINRLRENGVSRLPVMNENGELSGILTTNDIVNFVVRDEHRQGTGDRRGDLERMLDLPVYDLMSSPVTTAQPAESVREAVERMFEEDISGLIVTATPDSATVSGVLTKTDVLRALTYTEREQMDVQITNVGLLDMISREEIVDSIAQVVDKYQEMQVQHAHVRFHEHKEKLRGTPLIRCQIRVRSNRGQVAGSGEGYGAEQAFRVALDKLERNVLELKGVNADEQYRGQLLRKLGEL